jgi:delta 1-pyrroline-5-carboxylate dehydrogenase
MSEHDNIAMAVADVGSAAYARIERLEAALADAIECVESWAAYAHPYFRDKHKLDGDLERLRAAVAPVELSANTKAGQKEVFELQAVQIAHRTAWRYAHSSDPHHSHTYTFNRACLLDFAAELLAAERERILALVEAVRDANRASQDAEDCLIYTTAVQNAWAALLAELSDGAA